MIQSFKQFRKRHLSNDPGIALFPLGPCGKALTDEETSKHSLMKKDENEIKIGDDTLSDVGPTANSDDESVLMRHPMEPNEIDHPIRCPHPEPCIIQDGRALKERLPSIKRRGQLPFLTKQEVQSLRWDRRAAPSDCQIYPNASAPETSFTHLLQ